MSKISGNVVLITGADGGIGYELLKETIKRGASKIYATGINTKRLLEIEKEFGGIVRAITLDVTDNAQIVKVAEMCYDTSILFNNAGVEFAVSFGNPGALKKAALETNVNYLGVHNVSHSFLKHMLNRDTESYIVNVLSIASFVIIPQIATYCASKAAAHIFTQAFRQELKDTRIKVIGVYPGFVDTKMIKNFNVAKVTPELIASAVCEGIENGAESIFPDAMSKALSQTLTWQNQFYVSIL